jgi:hypothetical protein
MTIKEGPIRRLYSKLSGSSRSAARGPSAPSANADEPRETICAPKPVPKRCLNEAGHKAVY